MVAKERARPLLQAIVYFLNAGGDPADIEDFASTVGHMPQLDYREFELAGVREYNDREVYYVTSDQRVIRVFPGVVAEEVSQEELESDEEDTAEEADYEGS